MTMTAEVLFADWDQFGPIELIGLLAQGEVPADAVPEKFTKVGVVQLGEIKRDVNRLCRKLNRREAVEGLRPQRRMTAGDVIRVRSNGRLRDLVLTAAGLREL